jgi:hypothetical protein
MLCGLSEQTKQLICKSTEDHSQQYNSSRSKTFKNMDKEFWKHKLVDTRGLIGFYGKEKMSITAANNNFLLVDDFTFIRGVSLDLRLVFCIL